MEHMHKRMRGQSPATVLLVFGNNRGGLCKIYLKVETFDLLSSKKSW